MGEASPDDQLSEIDQFLTFCSQAVARFDQLIAGNDPHDRPVPDDEASLNETVDRLIDSSKRAMKSAELLDPSGRMEVLIGDLYHLVLIVITARYPEVLSSPDTQTRYWVEKLGVEGVEQAYSKYHSELHAMVAETRRRGRNGDRRA